MGGLETNLRGIMLGSEFSYFLKTIPPDMYSRTKATICQYIAIFEPREYIIGETICVDDYHFVLFFAGGPITRIGNVEYQANNATILCNQHQYQRYL